MKPYVRCFKESSIEDDELVYEGKKFNFRGDTYEVIDVGSPSSMCKSIFSDKTTSIDNSDIIEGSIDQKSIYEIYSPKGTLMIVSLKGSNIDITLGEASKHISPLKFIDLLQDAMRNSDIK